MRIEVDGEAIDIPDKDVIDYVADLQDDATPAQKLLFGLHVNHTGELTQAGEDIRNFIDILGGGEVEVQVSINPKLAQVEDRVLGFTADAIGFAMDSDIDDYEDWEDDDE